MQNKTLLGSLRFAPLTADVWPDLERLFGVRGACGGCWCMSWRLPKAEFERQKGAGNKAALRRVVGEGPPPGILAWSGSEPIGWCAVAPRQSYVRLARSRVLGPVDGQPVWSISCLFVRKEFRRRGVSAQLLLAAAELAAAHGATIVEGYPVAPYASNAPAAFLWTGTIASFEAAGFVEVKRGSPSRPIFRRSV
ncbi:MAG: GNAT family N-acetyltransferase [Bryobacteraceae bacterium]|jgi:GNAT superfamily N-acetyltransferase